MLAAASSRRAAQTLRPPSTGRGRSRIVPVIDKGLVTVPRTLVQFVVTEHGIADLRGRTARERAEALLAVAHPEHRSGLRAELDRR